MRSGFPREPDRCAGQAILAPIVIVGGAGIGKAANLIQVADELCRFPDR
jgi:predicted ATP-dependent serine protease